MYYTRSNNIVTAAAKGDWMCRRGTSKLEGYHSHLNAMLSGNNYSAEVADALLLLGNFRWNVKRAVENGKLDDFGCYDLWQIAEINSAMQMLNKPLPYPTWNPLTLPPEHNESFGCKYIAPDLDILAARQESSAMAAATAISTPAGLEPSPPLSPTGMPLGIVSALTRT